VAIRVLYLAHPVAGDVTENLARAMRWLKWFAAHDPETAFIAPWIAAILSGEDDSDPESRARGIRHCTEVVRRCDGVVLVGGRVSDGMAIERAAAVLARLPVYDLTFLGAEPVEHASMLSVLYGPVPLPEAR
jgi:hypothetical protein